MEKYFDSIENKTCLSDETKEFLKNFTHKRTTIMIGAIKKAIEGNSHMLDLVRDMRSAESFIAEGVTSINFEISDGDYKIASRIYLAPQNPENAPTMLYLHGGGWTIGDVNSCSEFCSKICLTSNINVVAFNYRLAPENKNPIALEDCKIVFDWLVSKKNYFEINKQKIIIAGDSAGGHLAIMLIHRLENSKFLKDIKGVILFYPVVTLLDRSGDESYKKYGRGYALDSDLMDAFNDAYEPEENKRKEISPLEFEDFDFFPPTLLITSGNDILCNQGIEFAKKLSKANVKIRHINVCEATHIYMTMAGMPKSFAIGLEESQNFIKNIT